MMKKSYKSIEETIAEVRKKDKRYNYMMLVIGLLLLVFVASLILYGQYKKKLQTIEHQQLELETKERELIALQLKNKESSQDSIANIITSIQDEITQIRINEENLSKDQLLRKLDVAQNKLEKISYKVNEKAIVQYYQSKGDKNDVINVVKSMGKFNLSVRQTIKMDAYQSSTTKSNTIYYGKDVDEKQVYALVENLKKQQIEIQKIDTFPVAKQNIKYQNTILICYTTNVSDKEQKINSEKIKRNASSVKIVNNNRNYTIRFYSFNPNNTVKKNLLTFFKKEKYTVRNYPDWKKKPSFFADVPTIFYYSSSTKEAAYTLRDQLQRKIRNIKFNVQRGSGYGISKKELDNTFIIHYIE